MFIVGLTGGIGCGKTTVGQLFVERGVIVIDADEIGKTLVQPGQPLLKKIADTFGPNILHEDGSLNRTALRECVFNDALKKNQLEAIMHPPILAEMQYQAKLAQSPYCIFSIPLLFETGQETLVTRILVVDIPVDIQYQRVMQRSGLSLQETRAIVNSQLPREQRLAHADDIIDNSGDFYQLEPQVDALHQCYLEFAQLSSKN